MDKSLPVSDNKLQSRRGKSQLSKMAPGRKRVGSKLALLILSVTSGQEYKVKLTILRICYGIMYKLL